MNLVKRFKSWLERVCLCILREDDTLTDFRRNYCNYSKNYKAY